MNGIELEKVKKNLIGQLNDISKDILTSFPVIEYLDNINKYPDYSFHKFISAEIQEVTSEIIKISDIQTLEIYHKLILISMIQNSIDGALINSFPEEIKELFINNYKFILEKIESPRTKKGFFLNSEDKFIKYMAIARLKMIPCGAQKVYAGSLPKKFLFTGGSAQFFRGISLIFGAGGRKPFFKMYMDSSDKSLMKEFNPEGWERFFKRVGLLLRTQENIKGVSGSSWFFDHVIKEISPELAYIRETAEKYGASFYYLKSHKGIIKDATFMSPKRIKLYKAGEYMPRSYLMVITRKDILNNLN